MHQELQLHIITQVCAIRLLLMNSSVWQYFHFAFCVSIHKQWRNRRGANCPCGKLNVKSGPQLRLYFSFSIRLFFTRLLFFGDFRSVFR